MTDRRIPKPNEPGLYMIVNHLTGSTYYGESSLVVARLRQHASLLRLDKHSNTSLQNDWRKYGSNEKRVHEFVVLVFGKEYRVHRDRLEMEVAYMQGRDPSMLHNVKRTLGPIKNTSSENFVPLTKANVKSKPKPVVLMGTAYVSINQAKRNLGCSTKFIRDVCKAFPDHCYFM